MTRESEAHDELEAEVGELKARLGQLEAKLRGSFRGGRAPGTRADVLLVTIGRLEAAFELEGVREVVPTAQLQPIPEAPPWVLGTLNLRGGTTPVVHIGARLAGGRAELVVEDLIVIAATQAGTAGFIVSAVGNIVEITLDQEASITDTPHASYVVGTFTHGGQSRLLLGIPELLRQADLRRLAHQGAEP
jgi:purine-binding chemotaxis protein CheW